MTTPSSTDCLQELCLIVDGERHFLEGEWRPSLPLIHEGKKLRIKAVARSDEKLRLLLSDDGVPPRLLRIVNGETTGLWEWTIEQYAGLMTVAVLLGDRVVRTVELDVSPNPAKLGADLYRRLLADLQQRAEGVIFGYGSASVATEQVEAATPALARVSLLRAYADDLLATYESIARAPHRRLISVREERPLHKVRRVDAQTLRAALRRMDVLAAVRQADNTLVTREPRLSVSENRTSFDTAPNRYLKYLVGMVVACCAETETALRRSDRSEDLEEDDLSVTRRRDRWADDLLKMGARFEEMLGAEFLRGVSPRPPTAGALMVIHRHPAYALFHQLACRIIAPKVALGANEERMSLRSTFDLYEYWCFFKTAELLPQVFPGLKWNRRSFVSRRGLLLDLKYGTYLEGTDENTTVRLSFQPTFGSDPRGRGEGPRSISRACRPDMVIWRRTEEDSQRVVLDAKYRAKTDTIHDALRDMHVYRDAIRSENAKRTVRAAFILTPAHAKDADVFYDPTYRQRYGIGGFDLQPENPGLDALFVEGLRGFFKTLDSREMAIGD